MYLCEKVKKHMSRWTGRRDMTKKLLKTALNPNHSMNQYSRSEISILGGWNVIAHVHNTYKWFASFNPFPHIDAFWRLCSRQLFENIVTKVEIAQNKQFPLLPQYFCVRKSRNIWVGKLAAMIWLNKRPKRASQYRSTAIRQKQRCPLVAFCFDQSTWLDGIW